MQFTYEVTREQLEDDLIATGRGSHADMVLVDFLLSVLRLLAEVELELTNSELQAEGSTGQPKMNPLLNEARALRTEARQIIAALGLTLPSRFEGTTVNSDGSIVKLKSRPATQQDLLDNLHGVVYEHP